MDITNIICVTTKVLKTSIIISYVDNFEYIIYVIEKKEIRKYGVMNCKL